MQNIIIERTKEKRRTDDDRSSSELFLHLQLLVYQIPPFYHTSTGRARDQFIGVHTSGKDMHYTVIRSPNESNPPPSLSLLLRLPRQNFSTNHPYNGTIHKIRTLKSASKWVISKKLLPPLSTSPRRQPRIEYHSNHGRM